MAASRESYYKLITKSKFQFLSQTITPCHSDIFIFILPLSGQAGDLEVHYQSNALLAHLPSSLLEGKIVSHFSPWSLSLHFPLYCIYLSALSFKGWNAYVHRAFLWDLLCTVWSELATLHPIAGVGKLLRVETFQSGRDVYMVLMSQPILNSRSHT